MIDWLVANKAWIFDGWGVAVISTLLGGLGSLIVWVFISRKAKASDGSIKRTASDQGIHVEGDVKGGMGSVQGDSVSAGGDVTFAKGGGTAVSIKNSQVGVVGDHSTITDGIHFKKE